MDTSRLPEHLRFVILCCKVEPTVEDIEAIRTHVKATEHLEEVSMLAYEHGVYPLFYLTLMKHASDLIDDEMKDAMAYIMQKIKIANIQMTSELLRLEEEYLSKNIEVLSFKGPVLAHLAYGDISLRQFSDLDILCKVEDFEKIYETMRKNGYEAIYSYEELNEKTFFEFNNDCPFVHEKKGLFLECHWDFFRKELEIPTENFRPWEDAKPIPFGHHTVKTLSDENHLLFLAAHGCKHFYEKLIWVTDIDRMIRSNPHLDWEEIMKKAKKLGILKILIYSLLLSSRHFETPIPPFVRQEKDTRSLKKVTYLDSVLFGKVDNIPVGSFKRVYEFSMLRDTIDLKFITLLASVLRPNKTDRVNIQLDEKYYFLYWPYRLYRLARREIERKILRQEV